MDRIRVPITAYILGLLPLSINSRGNASTTRGQQLQALANGLAVPSFWSRNEINDAFRVANDIWTRGASIEFAPINISERSVPVPADENGMWAHFLRHVSPNGRGIGVGFVYDLPSVDGGWGGGRIAVISGEKTRSGLPGYAGRILAHELGHVLTNSHRHSPTPSNLMYSSSNLRMVNAGMLTRPQIDAARRRAASI